MNRKTLFTALLLLLGRNVCSAGEPGPTIRFAEIPAGWFYMGSGGPGADYDETPIHKVVISRPFRMSVTEITNAQYEAFDPSHRALRGKQGFSSGDNEAVIFVDWHQADAFCRWLSEKEGRTYRLPTEAEWEYACRAGSCMHYSFGDRLPKAALKNQEEHHSFIPVDLTVAQSAPNAFGLYDMHGNVEEWCYDWYGPYFRGDQTDPVGYADGFYKVTRGGSHSTPVEYLRSAKCRFITITRINQSLILIQTYILITQLSVRSSHFQVTQPSQIFHKRFFRHIPSQTNRREISILIPFTKAGRTIRTQSTLNQITTIISIIGFNISRMH